MYITTENGLIWAPKRPRHDIYSQCTLYDCVYYYGYTMADLLGDYPIWDEEKREWLNNEIYLYFEQREIGPETPAKFASFAGRVMNRVMPRVNSIAAFALDSSSYQWRNASENVTTREGSSTGEDSRISVSSNDATDEAEYGSTVTETKNLTTGVSASTNSKASVLQSDTPQTQITGNHNYMTALQETGSSGSSSSSTSETGTDASAKTGTDTMTTEASASNSSSGSQSEEHEDVITQLGRGVPYSELASQWAETMPDLLGIIFESLESCFVQVFE